MSVSVGRVDTACAVLVWIMDGAQVDLAIHRAPSAIGADVSHRVDRWVKTQIAATSVR
jgi:hypothetical protein